MADHQAISATLARNLAEVRERIAAACGRARRDPHSVRLVAVTKTARLEWVRALIELGQTDLGESRPQQLAHRSAALPPSAEWHFIGHLQRNKVELTLPIARWIHSVDSFRLLECIAQQAAKSGVSPRILLEVNVSGEASKGGFPPDELRTAWEGLCARDSLSICGLMTMAPLVDDAESVRPVFRGLRELRDELVERCGGKLPLPELSMGMSGDFEVAVEEGATLVRIGSRLFTGLPDDETGIAQA